MRLQALALVMLLASTAGRAGSEFVVNTQRDTTQRDPEIAVDALGNAMAVWVSRELAGEGSAGDIALQAFDGSGAPVGTELLVNLRSAGDQERPAIALNAEGNGIVAWASFIDGDSLYDIRARMISGLVLSGQEIQVNTTRLFTQTNPAVAVDSTGRCVVVWDSWFQDGGDRGVFGRRIDPSGTPLGDEFQVNTTTAFSQARPAIRMRRGGGWAVVWESWQQESSGYGVFARLFDSDALPLSGEIQVNTTEEDYQWLADLEVFEDNSMAVVWCSWEQDGSDGAIILQMLDADGTKRGGERLVNVSTAQYQWLPRIRRRPGGGFAVAWSSWKQDGSREGVYARLFDADGRSASFETRVNETTESFQWEPALEVLPTGDLLVLWSSWSPGGADYDIFARRLTLEAPQGYLDPGSTGHSSGTSTSGIIIHVVDSLALTGHTYEVTFDSTGPGTAAATVRDSVTAAVVVDTYAIDRGPGVLYLTPAFDGVVLEFLPEFEFALDYQRSGFSGSAATLGFTLVTPGAGTRLLAPIDAALLWGSTDTLADGSWSVPLDTAINVQGQLNVQVPFRGWDLTNGEAMELLVVDGNNNRRWDPGERILLRTPVRYRSKITDMHAELITSIPAETLVLPTPGDTNYVYTRRPLTASDIYLFRTDRALIMDVDQNVPGDHFTLEQNYPNPFNPSTTIRFVLPQPGRASLRVYDIVGRLVATLLDGTASAGSHEFAFDGSAVASGMYVYVLRAPGGVRVRKMIMVK
jgi:hypothetical protein